MVILVNLVLELFRFKDDRLTPIFKVLRSMFLKRFGLQINVKITTPKINYIYKDTEHGKLSLKKLKFDY